MAPDIVEIKKWWTDWPDANPAIVCGEVSGVTVLDADSQAGYDALQEFISDSIVIPTSKTPKGYHHFFKYIPGISNNIRGLQDTDIKNDGGYVLVPPSKNYAGGYQWIQGLNIENVLPPEAPGFLVDTLSAVTHADLNSMYYKIDHYPYIECPQDNQNTSNQQLSTMSTSVHIDFTKGCRDNSLFHVANCLVKGHMDTANVRKCLQFLAANCEPPFPENQIEAKIQSALHRAKNRDLNITQEIRELILSTSGNMSSTYVHTCLQLSTRSEKKTASMALSRLVDEGLIERTGKRAGEFRILEEQSAAVDWCSAETESADLKLPFELSEMVIVSPGDIILFMGAQNAGKSAVLMNVAKENRDEYNVHYFSSEMGAGKFKRRMSRFRYISVDQMKSIKFYPPEKIKGNYADHIRPGKGNLNIIDYVEMHDRFWEISKTLDDIYRRLNGAICVAAIQKEPGREYGRGGSFTQEKPSLSISIDKGIATITKCKEWDDSKENPNGKQYHFKILDGCELTRRYFDLGWVKKQGG